MTADNTTRTALGKLRVMYVEDDRSIRLEMEQYLKRRVGTVMTARDGRAGREVPFIVGARPMDDAGGYVFAFTEISSMERERSELYRLATVDALTQAGNRLFIERQLRDVRGGDLSIILIDLDHLKLVNDQQGHQAGDRLLRAVADMIRANIRESDIFARWGGDEFALLVPGAGVRERTGPSSSRARTRHCTGRKPGGAIPWRFREHERRGRGGCRGGPEAVYYSLCGR